MLVRDTQKKLRTSSLRTSFVMFVCGLVVLTSIVFSASNVWFSTIGAKQEVERQAGRYITAYEMMMSHDVRKHGSIDPDLMKYAIDRTGNIQAAYFYDTDKNLIFSKAFDAKTNRLVSELTLKSLDQNKSESLTYDNGIILTSPIRVRGETIGYIGVKTPYAATGFSVKNTILWSIGTTCLICALALPLGIFLVHRITVPLKKLTDFASSISANQLSARVDVQAGNEFDTLAEAFNSMMQRVETTMRQIQKLAFVDSVTSLPNREHFMRQLQRALKVRGEECFSAVIVFNVDRFRWVNETLGPENGDEVLALIGMRIRKALLMADKTVRLEEAKNRPSIVARLGGDEFAVLVPNIDAKSDITRLMQMVVASMRQPLEISGQAVTLGLSGGIALAPIHGMKAEELLKNADLALKEARRAGRGKTRFYSSKLNKIAMDRLHLEADLRRAIEREEFIPYFQPKVCFKTGVIAGAEALVRWQRADGDLISPGIFIPMAEQLGLISKIGEVVLRESCQQATRWMKAGHDCKVAVNVSPLQFEESDFSEKVHSALRDADLPPGRLELEITETMAVADTDRVSEIMRPLRAMGVRLAIDDFGAGHSNLVTLTRLPFDVFKIDQQFVSALHSDKQAPAIVEMILAMAQTMGLESVAEGVETPSQSDFLRRRNCTLAQGYLYSKPLPPDEFAKFLDTWKPFGELADGDFLERLNDVA